MTEQVIVDFVIDPSSIDNAVQSLVNMGAIDQKIANQFKQTSTEINKQGQAVKAVAANTNAAKKGLDDVAKAAKNVSDNFMQGFQEGVLDALKEAGVTAEQFAEAMEKSGTASQESSKSLRQELKELTAQLAQMALAGADNTEEFSRLEERAGKIKDALRGVGESINRVGDGELVIRGIGEAAQGVTGAFAIAQGTTALFGDESEELQRTLLKVNAAMAILQGLQSVSAVLQKESNLSLLISNRQRIIQNAQIAIENGLQSTSIVVRTGATVAQKALNAAMAANPIGVVVVALAGLVTLIASYAENTREAAAATAALNAALDSSGQQLEAQIEGIQSKNQRIIADMEKRGELESSIQRQTLEGDRQVQQARIDELNKLYAARDAARDADAEKQKEVNDRIQDLETKIYQANTEGLIARTEMERKANEESLTSYAASIEAQLAKAAEGSARQLDLRKKQIEAQKALELNAAGLTEGEKAAIIAKAQEAQLELQAEYNKRKIDLEIKGIETRLINVKEGSDEELRLNKDLLDRKLEAELTSTKLSEAEKIAIIQNYLAQREKLERDASKAMQTLELNNQVSRNNVAIAALNVSNADKLLLTEENLKAQAEIEVIAANENSEKIKEIYAKRDADIRAARAANIDAELQYDLQITAARTGAERRALERTVADEKKSYADRISAREQLTDYQLEGIDSEMLALEDKYQQQLVSDKDYQLQYEQLLDRRKEAVEKNEEDIKNLRLAKFQETFNVIMEIAGAIGGVFNTIIDIQNQQDANRLAVMQEQLDAAREAGAITEKEAITRQKRIEAEERKAKQAQAQREKAMAVFNALMAIPEAYLKGLLTGGPVLGAIYAGIAGIQAGLIAARPLPKFGKGKKKTDRYEGWAQVGETGTEIHQVDGQMFLVNKPSVRWVGKDDVILNPQDTRSLMSKPIPSGRGEILTKQTGQGIIIDYERMEKMHAKYQSSTSVNIHKDFVEESVANGMMKANYFSNRYQMFRKN